MVIYSLTFLTTHIKETPMGQNYFNSLPLRRQLQELGTCRFMDASEFANGCEYAKGKKIVIVGCGAQGSQPGSQHARQWPRCFLHPAQGGYRAKASVLPECYRKRLRRRHLRRNAADCRYRHEPCSRQAAHRRGEHRGAADEAGRGLFLRSRLQYRRRRHPDPQGT